MCAFLYVYILVYLFEEGDNKFNIVWVLLKGFVMFVEIGRLYSKGLINCSNFFNGRSIDKEGVEKLRERERRD